MFIITSSKDKTINWPVKVDVAVNGGKIAKHEFTGIFKVLDDDEREAIVAEATADAPKLDASDIGGDDQVTATEIDWKETAVDSIMKVMTGWTGVVDESRQPIEFTRENLRAATRSAAGVAVLRGIHTAIAEIAQGARAKN